MSLNRIYRHLANREAKERDALLPDLDLREFGVQLSKLTAALRGDPSEEVLHDHLYRIGSALAGFGQVKHRGVIKDLDDLSELIARFTQAEAEARTASKVAGLDRRFTIKPGFDRIAIMCELALEYLCDRSKRLNALAV